MIMLSISHLADGHIMQICPTARKRGKAAPGEPGISSFSGRVYAALALDPRKAARVRVTPHKCGR
jgi:hypothetical protein